MAASLGFEPEANQDKHGLGGQGTQLLAQLDQAAVENLSKIFVAWPRLNESLRGAIMAIVRSAPACAEVRP